MEHLAYAPPHASWSAWTKHSFDVPPEMKHDWGPYPPLTLDKEDAAMLGWRPSATPSPLRGPPSDEVLEIDAAVIRCKERGREDTTGQVGDPLPLL